MEMAKVVGSSQPADAQRQAMLDLDNYYFILLKDGMYLCKREFVGNKKQVFCIRNWRSCSNNC